MLIFFVILAVGLTLIYLNVSAVAPGKKGRLIALSLLLVIFLGMVSRNSLVGCAVVAFTSVWLCQALLMYLPWGLFRVVRRIIMRRPLVQQTVTRVCRVLLAVTVVLTVGIIAFGVPHNADYRLMNTTVNLPSRYAVQVPSATETAQDSVPSDSATVGAVEPRNASFTAVFFSDIHVDPLFRRAKLERMIAEVDSIAPDYLLFGGDLADVPTSTLDEWGYDTLFRKLTSKARIASVAVNGNHEGMQERSGSDPNGWMRKVGFVVLDDSTACLGKACFTGRTDFQVARGRGVERRPLAELVPADVPDDSGAVQSARPWILLDHQPKGIEPGYSGRLPDYALSGHTHNGQFFPGTVVINLVWRLAYGEGVLDGVHWLVSAGVDCWGPPVRVGTDADMWVVRFVR